MSENSGGAEDTLAIIGQHEEAVEVVAERDDSLGAAARMMLSAERGEEIAKKDYVEAGFSAESSDSTNFGDLGRVVWNHTSTPSDEELKEAGRRVLRAAKEVEDEGRV
ncbi:hypothetical protein DMJ13_03605 [halophilic archaeon]|nr:hypothetical protein DMJ13_03605 [halophilic archaeon]